MAELDVSTTAKAQAHLRAIRAEEEAELRDHWLPLWRRSRILPTWLDQHHRGSAADQLRRRGRFLSVTRVEDLLHRACYDEACKRVARTAKRRPEVARGRSVKGEKRAFSAHLGTYTERPSWATA